jgi:hypothetical protein
MTRKMRATIRQVQISRQDWYLFHLENRNLALALPASEIQTYITACGYTRPPQMSVFGGLSIDYPDRKVYEIAEIWKLNIHLVCPWYLTNQGWEEFQTLWQQLPEPVNVYSETVHTPWVQVGDLSTVVHMPAESLPPKRPK